MSDNVITFPKNKKSDSTDALPSTQDESQSILETVHIDYIEEVTEALTNRLGGELACFGFHPREDRKFQKDWLMVNEAIEAMLYRYAKLNHPIHSFTEEIFKFPDEQKAAKKPTKAKAKKKTPEPEVKS